MKFWVELVGKTCSRSPARTICEPERATAAMLSLLGLPPRSSLKVSRPVPLNVGVERAVGVEPGHGVVGRFRRSLLPSVNWADPATTIGHSGWTTTALAVSNSGDAPATWKSTVVVPVPLNVVSGVPLAFNWAMAKTWSLLVDVDVDPTATILPSGARASACGGERVLGRGTRAEADQGDARIAERRVEGAVGRELGDHPLLGGSGQGARRRRQAQDVDFAVGLHDDVDAGHVVDHAAGDDRDHRRAARAERRMVRAVDVQLRDEQGPRFRPRCSGRRYYMFAGCRPLPPDRPARRSR